MNEAGYEFRMKLIHDEAELIRRRIERGTLYGIPIDMNNPDMVLYAAWIMATMPVYTGNVVSKTEEKP